MGTVSLRGLRNNLGDTIRTVAHTGREVIVTDHGKEIAVIIGMVDYERLHEHADTADRPNPAPTSNAQWIAERDARPAVLDAHKSALQKIDTIVGNESRLGPDECARIRGVLFAALSEQHQRDVGP